MASGCGCVAIEKMMDHTQTHTYIHAHTHTHTHAPHPHRPPVSPQSLCSGGPVQSGHHPPRQGRTHSTLPGRHAGAGEDCRGWCGLSILGVVLA